MRQNNKGNLSIVLGIIASIIVIALGIGAAVFLTIKADKEGASEVAELFVSSFGNIDINHLDDCIPSEMFEDWRIDILIDEESYESMDFCDHSVENVEVNSVTRYDKNKTKEDISRDYEINLDVKVAYLVTVAYTEYYTVDGEEEEENLIDELICGKVGQYWYVLDPEVYSEKLETIEWFNDTADEELAKELIMDYLDAFSRLDITGMKNCVPEEVLDVDSVDVGYDELDDLFEDLADYEFAINDVKIKDQDEYDKAEAKNSIKDEFGVELDIEKAYEISADYNVHMEFAGEDYDEVESADVICGKIDGEWYIVDPSEIVTD